MDRVLKVRGHLPILNLGNQKTTKPIRCQDTQEVVGIFYVIWTQLIQLNFAVDKQVIIGDK